jgi:hypothetical protein
MSAYIRTVVRAFNCQARCIVQALYDEHLQHLTACRRYTGSTATSSRSTSAASPPPTAPQEAPDRWPAPARCDAAPSLRPRTVHALESSCTADKIDVSYYRTARVQKLQWTEQKFGSNLARVGPVEMHTQIYSLSDTCMHISHVAWSNDCITCAMRWQLLIAQACFDACSTCLDSGIWCYVCTIGQPSQCRKYCYSNLQGRARCLHGTCICDRLRLTCITHA